ncbi:MAG: DUF1549 domain-containing protein [Acidobacteriota bacterium]|nr:DUF1549 domain-containing protein [Acidobacteriota bacterium]
MTWLLCLLLASSTLTAHEGMVNGKNSRRDGNIRHIERDVEIIGNVRGNPDNTDWEAAQVQNTIDELTFAKMQADGVPVNALADDSIFIRRLYLVLTGRLPDPQRTRTFLADTNPNKRTELIDEVLATEAFSTHWAFYFQEFFESTASELRWGHKLYNSYWTEAVQSDKKLDVIARELITADGLTDEVPEAGFLARSGAGQRLSQDVWDNAAVAASTKFLGVPLECISCHDGAYHLESINLFLAERQRAEVWGMAAFFSDFLMRPGTRNDNGNPVSVNIQQNRNPGYMAETDNGTRPARSGGLIEPVNIFTGDTVPAGQSSREAIAEQITTDRQFARNWANRFWGELFGLAMVEPMDSFDLYRIDPTYPLPEGWEMQVLDVNLLEHMADKMIEFNFSIRDYLRYVCNSATFQMSPDFYPGDWQNQYAPYYTRYLAHHMDAETAYDSLVVATGAAAQMTQVYAGATRDVFTSTYAHELIDMNQPRGARGLNPDILTMLTVFGRGNRTDQPRTNQGSISQALVLMSSPVIDAQISATQNRVIGYVSAGMSTEQVIQEAFLDVLCRYPTDEEVDAYGAELDRFNNDREKAESLLWLLINRVEFTYIY